VKFLIDECLSLDLVAVARGSGFGGSSHVVWLGKGGWKDGTLKFHSGQKLRVVKYLLPV